jgi:hypothetical protein
MAFLDPPDVTQRRRRYWIAGGSVLATAIIIVAFLVESRWGYLPPDPKLIYVQSWKANRSKADALADRAATIAAREAKLAEARAYIATLKGKAREDAQKQYDDYVAGGGARKDIPYVAAAPSVTPIVRVPSQRPALPPPAEPPVE